MSNISPINPIPSTPVDWRDIKALREEILQLRTRVDQLEAMLLELLKVRTK